jgi:polar amino acid transport system permease protein
MDFWSWDKVADLWPALLAGFRVILIVTVLAAVLALALGLVVAIVNRIAPKVITAPLFAIMEFIRNTPLLVQLFFVWFGLRPLLGDLTATSVGVAVLGVHYASYTAEAYRAGFDGIPKGQWEAITALSLPRYRAWLDVLIPQMLRRSTPALGNYLIAMFKEVPILSAIGVAEMVNQITNYTGRTYGGDVEGYTIAGLMFLAVSYPIALLMRKLEKRLAN